MSTTHPMEKGPEGIRFLVEDHTLPISVMTMALPTGSLQDPIGKEGLAYLTSKMLSRGAGDLSQVQIAQAVERLGSSLGIAVHRENITVGGDALSRHLNQFEALVQLILSQPTFPEEELTKLKRLVMIEHRQLRDNDAGLAQRGFLRRLYRDHPYGRLMTGTDATISAINRDDVRRFYGEHLRSGNTVCGAAGNLDQARHGQWVEHTVGSLPPGDEARASVPKTVPPSGVDLRVVNKASRTQTQVFMGQTTISARHPDYLPLLVGHTLFGGTFTSRLTQEIREKRGWSYGAYSALSADRHLGTFMMRFYPATADTLSAIKVSDDLFQHFVKDGATDDEVDFAKRYLTQNHVFSMETPEKRLNEIISAHQQGHSRDWLDTFVSRIDAITAADVNRAVKAHLDPDRFVVTILGTASALMSEFETWDRAAGFEVIEHLEV